MNQSLNRGEPTNRDCTAEHGTPVDSKASSTSTNSIDRSSSVDTADWTYQWLCIRNKSIDRCQRSHISSDLDMTKWYVHEERERDMLYVFLLSIACGDGISKCLQRLFKDATDPVSLPVYESHVGIALNILDLEMWLVRIGAASP